MIIGYGFTVSTLKDHLLTDTYSDSYTQKTFLEDFTMGIVIKKPFAEHKEKFFPDIHGFVIPGKEHLIFVGIPACLPWHANMQLDEEAADCQLNSFLEEVFKIYRPWSQYIELDESLPEGYTIGR